MAPCAQGDGLFWDRGGGILSPIRWLRLMLEMEPVVTPGPPSSQQEGRVSEGRVEASLQEIKRQSVLETFARGERPLLWRHVRSPAAGGSGVRPACRVGTGPWGRERPPAPQERELGAARPGLGRRRRRLDRGSLSPWGDASHFPGSPVFAGIGLKRTSTLPGLARLKCSQVKF